jgi:hypothetical protein
MWSLSISVSDHIAVNTPVSASTEGRITVAGRTYLPGLHKPVLQLSQLH